MHFIFSLQQVLCQGQILAHNLPRFLAKLSLVYKMTLMSGSGHISRSLPCFHLQSSSVVLKADGLPRNRACWMMFCAFESGELRKRLGKLCHRSKKSMLSEQFINFLFGPKPNFSNSLCHKTFLESLPNPIEGSKYVYANWLWLLPLQQLHFQREFTKLLKGTERQLITFRSWF